MIDFGISAIKLNFRHFLDFAIHRKRHVLYCVIHVFVEKCGSQCLEGCFLFVQIPTCSIFCEIVHGFACFVLDFVWFGLFLVVLAVIFNAIALVLHANRVLSSVFYIDLQCKSFWLVVLGFIL